MFNTLIFGSGANRGIMYGGVIKSLEKRGILSQIDTFVGTSIGALFAAACAIGLNADEIHKIVLRTNIRDCKPNDELEVMNLYTKFAMYTNKKREHVVSNIIAQGRDTFSDITLKQLYIRTGNTLIITSCCVNTQTTEYISFKTNPDMSVVRCICMSMTVPFLFEPYMEDDFTYVDGATFGHSFPIDFKPANIDRCLGFRLRGTPKSIAVTNIVDYATGLFLGRSPSLACLKHTVDLVCDINLLEDVISNEKKEELMQYAFGVTERYLDIHA